MIHYWIPSHSIKDNIYIPKYYNPELAEVICNYSRTHRFVTIEQLTNEGVIAFSTGHEIGKAAYGTGDIPFVRTSDISNWEIKSTPKQGISKEIYDKYATDQDVREGDILFVRDGTYLIGNNCVVTLIDKELIYQSHILKVRVLKTNELSPYILFIAFNNPWVQRQIRSFQFTADIIDTIGQRFNEITIPIPLDPHLKEHLIKNCMHALETRMIGRAFIKHCPQMMEEVLKYGSEIVFSQYDESTMAKKIEKVTNRTVSSEFGQFTSFWIHSDDVKNSIYLPKYYDISIKEELADLQTHADLYTIEQLIELKWLEYSTGDEIGKMEYGTGDIPFLRTSDFANWEIFHTPKQGISEEVYNKYSDKQDVRENDILLVRDGTYLVGASCIITEHDVKSLFCGGLFKIRMLNDQLDPFLFLGLLNSYIVKRQIRTKQFTRDVIDTIGNRINEVVIPIPRSVSLRNAISQYIKNIVTSRIRARNELSSLSNEILQNME